MRTPWCFLPNLLSLARIAGTPFLLLVALHEKRGGFLLLLAVLLATDGLDGWLARRFSAASELGARLDSLGDFLLFGMATAGIYLLWPETVLNERLFVTTALIAWLVPFLAGLVKFRRLTSYHTLLAKLSAILLGGGVLLLLTTGNNILFRLAVCVFTLSGIEEVLITLTLRRWRADIPSLLSAIELRRTEDKPL